MVIVVVMKVTEAGLEATSHLEILYIPVRPMCEDQCVQCVDGKEDGYLR